MTNCLTLKLPLLILGIVSLFVGVYLQSWVGGIESTVGVQSLVASYRTPAWFVF